jgi:putrescine transport system ATP-binding protein
MGEKQGLAHTDGSPARQVDKTNEYIRIEHVTKRFGDFVAVDNVTLSVFKGEIFCLLGGSGCGKTTLLRMLAGFEAPTSGRIFIDGQDMADTLPYERPVNMMFQSYALFPHMSVEKNVAFGLEQEKLPRKEIDQRVAEMLDTVKLGELARRKPHQLSGGELRWPGHWSRSRSSCCWTSRWGPSTRNCVKPPSSN